MVIAAGPRIINSSMGPITWADVTNPKGVSISVTFDRPVDPATVKPGDVQVFYHDTANGDASIPLKVTSFAPTGGGSSPATQFTATFDPKTKADGTPSGITNFTGTYSYLIAPDDGQGHVIAAPIQAYVTTPVAKPVIGPIASTNVPLPIPSSGTGGSGTPADITTSTITIPPSHPGQLITGITVRLSLTPSPRQRRDDHARRSRRPLHGPSSGASATAP